MSALELNPGSVLKYFRLKNDEWLGPERLYSFFQADDPRRRCTFQREYVRDEQGLIDYLLKHRVGERGDPFFVTESLSVAFMQAFFNALVVKPKNADMVERIRDKAIYFEHVDGLIYMVPEMAYERDRIIMPDGSLWWVENWFEAEEEVPQPGSMVCLDSPWPGWSLEVTARMTFGVIATKV